MSTAFEVALDERENNLLAISNHSVSLNVINNYTSRQHSNQSSVVIIGAQQEICLIHI